MPVRELKIDRSFVMNLPVDENNQAIVRSIIGLGHGFGHHVVAEGVEDLTTYVMLHRAGCDMAQGYFVSRPLPASRFDEWLLNEWPARIPQLARATLTDIPIPRGSFELDDQSDVLGARLNVYEQLIASKNPAAVAKALHEYVLAVGGRVGTGDEMNTADLLPIDISVGEGNPMLPIAAAGSRARRQLDRTLPKVVADARRMAALIRDHAT